MISNPVNAITPLTRRNFHGLNLDVFSCQHKEYEMKKTSKMSGWFMRNFFLKSVAVSNFELLTRQSILGLIFKCDGNEGIDG